MKRRHLLRQAAATLPAITALSVGADGLAAAQSVADPHMAWSAEFFGLIHYINTCGDPRDVFDTEAGKRSYHLADLIAETRATTLLGILAQLQFGRRAEEEEAASDHACATALDTAVDALEGMVRGSATLPAAVTFSAGAGGQAGSTAGPHPDTALLALAAMAVQAREVERATPGSDEDALAQACDVTDGLVRQMATIRATTFDGFRAKAKVAGWYALPASGGEELYIEDVATRSLLRDLLA